MHTANYDWQPVDQIYCPEESTTTQQQQQPLQHQVHAQTAVQQSQRPTSTFPNGTATASGR